MADVESPGADEVRAAEVIAALCLATDLGMGFPLEHGLRGTVVAMRLAERLGADRETAWQTYYAALLFHSGCTTDAELAADIFGSDLTTHFVPHMFGSDRRALAGILRALPDPGAAAPTRAIQIARRLPRAARTQRPHLRAACEVAEMLSERLGLPASVNRLFPYMTERWDGKGSLRRAKGEGLPLALRIAHVAGDAVVQELVGGVEQAERAARERAGHAFDPEVAECFAEGVAELLAFDEGGSLWDEVLGTEPAPAAVLQGEAIDRALAAIGAFADLASPYLVGHSSGVADLAASAAEHARLGGAERTAVRRAGFVHDVGRVAVSVRIWHKAGGLTPDEWEQVRLHAYHSERVLARSPFLAALAPVATSHHERCDGSGYHRGTTSAMLTAPARLLAAADAYHAMTEPRPHREPLSPEVAAETLVAEAAAGRLDADAVTAVLEAAGQAVPRLERPAGLTEREAQVVGLLARGLQTKEIARALGISPKTADRHVQNAYGKIGVSTRAAATLFAMEHGFAAWGELPIVAGSGRP